MGDKIQKAYYAIIPGNVRYDKELTANAKLLYGEITALCNEKGYCWASNEYFADLYGVSKVSISKWVSQLVNKGYLESEMNYKEGTKEILNRYLTIVNTPIKEKFTTSQTKVNEGHKEKLNTPIKEKLKDNNTSFNNTSLNNNYIVEIINHLNQVCGTNYKPTTKKNKQFIEARFKEGFTVEEFKTVINNMHTKWKGTEWQQYLRPSTLFNGEKFEGYLNMQVIDRTTIEGHGLEKSPELPY